MTPEQVRGDTEQVRGDTEQVRGDTEQVRGDPEQVRGAQPNPHRGEASIPIGGKVHLLRPTFEALVLAEEELGPLFALVERAGAGQLKLAEMADLFWFCLVEREQVSRAEVGRAIAEQGLAACAAPLRALLGQILQGHG